MKKWLVITVSVLAFVIPMLACTTPSAPEYQRGMVRYNDRWITREEYAQIQSGEQTNESQPLPAPTSPSPAQVVPSPTPTESTWKLVDLSYKIIETNDVWWKFAWIAEIKNNIAVPQSLILDIKFLDKDGFVVDDTLAEIELQPYEQKECRDYALIDTNIAPNVVRAIAEEY